MTEFVLDAEQVRSHVARQLESWVESMPVEEQTKPFIAIAGGEGMPPLTPRDVLRNVQQGTALGIQLLQHAAGLAISDFLIDGSGSH
jgi:hypothetical protein